MNIKPRIEVKTETDNTKAYEYYLRSENLYKNNFAYPAKPTFDDYQVIKKLLNKAISLDDDFIVAKLELIGINIEEYSFNFSEEELVGDKDFFEHLWTEGKKE